MSLFIKNRDEFVSSLIDAGPQGPDAFNPWAERNEDDAPDNTPRARQERLRQHLSCSEVKLIACGEAPGYQGARHSGIAFTSERLLGEGSIPRIGRLYRLSTRKRPFSEPSATIVWGVLHELGLAESTILWNAYPFHPRKNGDPLTNRTPTTAEIAIGVRWVRGLTEIFPNADLVAVGEKSAMLFREHLPDVHIRATVRHPANGGAMKFRKQLAELMGRAQSLEMPLPTQAGLDF